MAKDHVVPRFLLQNFTDPASRTQPNPYLWVADLQEGTCRARSPKNVAALSGFYDWQVAGHLASSIEEMLSRVESLAAPVFRRFIQRDYSLTLEEREEIVWFIALQICRLPRFFDSIDKQLGITSKERSAGTGTRSDNIPDYIIERFGVISTNEASPRDYLLSAGMLHAAALMKPLRMMSLSCATPPKNREFLTSDQPVVLNSRINWTRPLEMSGFNNEHVQIALPIGPYCAVVLHGDYLFNGQPLFTVNKRSARDLRTQNFGFIATARRYVYCSTREHDAWALDNLDVARQLIPTHAIVP